MSDDIEAQPQAAANSSLACPSSLSQGSPVNRKSTPAPCGPEPTSANDHRDTDSGGGLEEIKTTKPTRWERVRRELRRITINFTPSWFSVNMGTGITSILLYTLPYQFNGLKIIADVIFGLNVVIFLLFLGISIARYTVWPNIFKTMIFHSTQSLFLGTFAMGLATIVNMCALSCAPAFGPRFAYFTWALWWIDSIISLSICVGLPLLQFTRHEQSFDQITAVWFLPVVTTIVASASGGIVASILPSASHVRLTLIVSYVLWGTGFSTALLLMALYYARLAIYKIPQAALIVSVFLPLGPCGQGAFALLKLSESVYDLSMSTGQALGSATGGITPDEARIMALAVYGATIPIALVLWGLGFFWLLIAVLTLADLALVADLRFNLGWWGFTFPLGVFCTATIQLGKELDSGALKILGTVLSGAEVALWVFVAGMTAWQAVQGQIFFAPCLGPYGGEPPKHVSSARKYVFEPRSRSRGRSLSRTPR